MDCVTGERLGPDFPALMTFNQGGTLNAYAIPPNGTTPALTSPEYGVFNREPGAGNFSFRDVGYSYDSSRGLYWEFGNYRNRTTCDRRR